MNKISQKGLLTELQCQTDFSECDDILQILAYERYEDLPEEEWDNKQQTNKQQTNEETNE